MARPSGSLLREFGLPFSRSGEWGFWEAKKMSQEVDGNACTWMQDLCLLAEAVCVAEVPPHTELGAEWQGTSAYALVTMAGSPGPPTQGNKQTNPHCALGGVSTSSTIRGAWMFAGTCREDASPPSFKPSLCRPLSQHGFLPSASFHSLWAFWGGLFVFFSPDAAPNTEGSTGRSVLVEPSEWREISGGMSGRSCCLTRAFPHRISKTPHAYLLYTDYTGFTYIHHLVRKAEFKL